MYYLCGRVFTSHSREEADSHEVLTPLKIIRPLLVAVWGQRHALHFITDTICHSEISQDYHNSNYIYSQQIFQIVNQRYCNEHLKKRILISCVTDIESPLGLAVVPDDLAGGGEPGHALLEQLPRDAVRGVHHGGAPHARHA